MLTFVQRGRRWYVASDSDADSDLPETGHADPWDRRAMVAREGGHVLVLADAEDKGRLGALVRVSDAAVSKVARMWPDGWRRKVVVVAVRDQQLIETYFRTELQSSDEVAAIAVPAFDTVPGWTPRDRPSYDDEGDAATRSRVILNPRYFEPGNDDNAVLLTHEVTHVATQTRTLAGAPTWLVEGIADYTAYRTLGRSRSRFRARSRRRSSPARSTSRRTTSTSTTSRPTTSSGSSPAPSSRTGTARGPCAATTAHSRRRPGRSRPRLAPSR